MDEHRERTRRKRVELGLLPDGDEPNDEARDWIVEVWRLQAASRDADARDLLGRVWSWAMGSGGERAAPVALRLLDRLGFVTDDEDAWANLPDDLVIFRAESDPEPGRGLCWTIEIDISVMHAERHGLPITAGRIRKGDALAFLTRNGEAEVVVLRENIREARTIR